MAAVRGLAASLLGVYDVACKLYAIADAVNSYERMLAVFQPPHTFWARGITRLAHARWRDAPLDDDDVRVTLPPAIVRDVVPTEDDATGDGGVTMSKLHGNMATTLSFGGPERNDYAIACYESAIAALRAGLPSCAARDLREARYQKAMAVLHECGNRPESARAADAAEEQRAEDELLSQLRNDGGSGGSSDSIMAAALRLAASGSAAGCCDKEEQWMSRAELEETERQWRDRSQAPTSDAAAAAAHMCGSVLERTSHTEACRMRWLLRAAALPGAARAFKSAALLACRACGAPPGDDDATKLRLCSGGCGGRVAYCGRACQTADWRRHKSCCAGAEANSAKAALKDGVCAVCHEPLLPNEEDDAAEVMQFPPCCRRVVLIRCLHLAHARCDSRHGCAVCS
jgi:hypothetical protein